MNRAENRSRPLQTLRFAAAFPVFFVLGSAFAALSEVPRVPFSGVYGATSGAGSLTGWQRQGGENPAVFGIPGAALSIAGYAPFGLEELRVLEASASFDRAGWGSSVAWRGLFAEDRHRASATRAQFAAKWGKGWRGGGSLAFQAGDGTPGVGSGLGASLGLLWKPFSFLSFGSAWERPSTATGANQQWGIGGDVGGRFGTKTRLRNGGGVGNATGYGWRVSAEEFLRSGGPAESRYGFAFQFHPLLAVYAGFAPARETASLGVRFGMGGFEGFSALRRHGSLGGTSIQGLQWRPGGI